MMTEPAHDAGANDGRTAVPSLELLTVDEVAKRLKIGRSTVYLLCKNNELPHVTIHRSVRIPADRLEHWLKERIQA